MIERIKLDKIERVGMGNIWGPSGNPTLLTFKVKENLSKNYLSVVGTKKAMPYLARLLKEKGVPYAVLKSRTLVYVSKQFLEETVKGVKDPIIVIEKKE